MILFFGAVLAGRSIAARAMAQLDDLDRKKAAGVFERIRLSGLIPVGILVVIFFAQPKLPESWSLFVYAATWVSLLGYFVFLHFYTRGRMMALGLPKTYLDAYGKSRLLWYVGFVLLLGGLVVPFFWDLD